MNLSAVNKSVTLIGRLFDPHKATEAYLPITKKPAYVPDSLEKLPRVSPESEGVSSGALEKLLTELENDPTLNMHSVVIARHGKILCEAGFGNETPQIWKYTFSASKSVVSLAVGIMIGKGLMTLEERPADVFPDKVGPVARLRIAPITVRDLLTMRSGIVFNETESMTEEDWVRACLNSAVSGEIGKTFNYNSLNTYLLSAMICKKTGKTLSAFLDENLFGPMGITNYFWECCPKGIEKGGWGLYILPEDMIKLATLIVNDGVWEGKQLVPASYLHEAAKAQAIPQASCGDYDYGYQMWVGRRCKSFLFNGLFGQNAFGFFDTGITVMTNAGNDELFQQSSVYAILDRYFAPGGEAFCEKAEPDPKEEYELTCTLCRLQHLTPPAAPEPEPESEPTPTPEPVSKPAPEPKKSFLARVFAFLKNGPEQEQTEPVPTENVSTESEPELPVVPEPRRLPEEAHLLTGKIFIQADSEPAASIGLLPVVLQVIHHNYTKGFTSLSFDRRTDGDGNETLVMAYHEEDGVYEFPIGVRTYPAPQTRLYFHGEPFLVAADGRFAKDEDGNDVFCVRCDFLETPCSRIMKLFFHRDGSIVFREEELPGAHLAVRAVLNIKEEASAQPLLGMAMDKIDNDYLAYRIRRTLAPELILKAEETNS
ncbi:MAG: beta-lactamase family protein [Clostridia bacterium]|nr:beta-lactamase family protein [Clostridia bacterium]